MVDISFFHFSFVKFIKRMLYNTNNEYNYSHGDFSKLQNRYLSRHQIFTRDNI